MKKTNLIIVTLLIQLVVSLGMGSGVAYGNAYNRAPSGLIIWNENLSGLSRSQVIKRLFNSLPTAVTYKGTVYPLKLDLTHAGIEQLLDKVFMDNKGFWFVDFLQSLSKPPLSEISKKIGLNRGEVISQLKTLSKSIDQPMRPATIEFAGGHLIRTAGYAGQELDVKGTWAKLEQEHKSRQVPVVIKSVSPKPDSTDVTNVKNVLGDYTTYFDPQEISRTYNLCLAAKALNNYLVSPGQVFSFNEVVGDCTEAKGYKPAYVFSGKSVVTGDGGGVCQDSSTLFLAVQQAHLKVVERHAHTLPVTYVPVGKDATVSYGELDFRFKNNTQGYLLISAQTGGNWLRIRLFGLADNNHPTLQKPDGYPYRPSDLDQYEK